MHKDEYDYSFSKTIVHVLLAKESESLLISRSEAKRIVNRLEKFKIAILDFQSIDSIGRAFADELFRVFPAINPTVELITINANDAILKMIAYAKQPK